MVRSLRNFLLLALLGGGSVAEAGLLIAPAVKWTSFSPRPIDTEITPNYYGYGGDLMVGFSAGQVFDMAGFGTYIPGKRKNPEVGGDDVTLINYGAAIGFRLASSVYVGFRGGNSAFSVQRVVDESDIDHRHEGLGGGISLGAISKLSKQSFLQTTFDLSHHVLTSSKDSTVKRRFDAVSVSLAYVFNGYASSMVENKIFKSFLDSISLF